MAKQAGLEPKQRLRVPGGAYLGTSRYVPARVLDCVSGSDASCRDAHALAPHALRGADACECCCCQMKEGGALFETYAIGVVKLASVENFTSVRTHKLRNPPRNPTSRPDFSPCFRITNTRPECAMASLSLPSSTT
eukprot:1173742-Rhodomonas_salina.1